MNQSPLFPLNYLFQQYVFASRIKIEGCQIFLPNWVKLAPEGAIPELCNIIFPYNNNSPFGAKLTHFGLNSNTPISS